MSSMQEMRETLCAMGFDDDLITQAMKQSSTLDQAIDWIEKYQQPSDEQGEINETQLTAASLQCQDADAAQSHALKTEHANFTESTTQIIPLTAEQKAAKLERLAIKRATKVELEKEETKHREKARRTTGRDVQLAKEKLQEQEMAKALADKKREKEDDRIARARIKAQIEQDKLDRAVKRIAESSQQASSVPAIVEALKPVVVQTSTAGYDDARLQFRLSDGPALNHVFSANDSLQVVFDHLQAKSITFSRLITTFPKKVYTFSDAPKTLKELGLVPSSALIVQ